MTGRTPNDLSGLYDSVTVAEAKVWSGDDWAEYLRWRPDGDRIVERLARHLRQDGSQS